MGWVWTPTPSPLWINTVADIYHLQSSLKLYTKCCTHEWSKLCICAESTHSNLFFFLVRSYTGQALGTSFIMKLYCTPLAILGSGHLAPSGTRMHLKPWFLYRRRAAMLFTSQCNAIDRHPQLLARASASWTNILAIPFRRSSFRTATFAMYAIPVLQKLEITPSTF